MLCVPAPQTDCISGLHKQKSGCICRFPMLKFKHRTFCPAGSASAAVRGILRKGSSIEGNRKYYNEERQREQYYPAEGHVRLPLIKRLASRKKCGVKKYRGKIG